MAHYKGARKRSAERKPFSPMFHVGVQSGTVIYDDLKESIGHIYDQAKYDAEGNRHEHRVIEAPWRSTFHVEDNKVTHPDFDPEYCCESCFASHRKIVELRVKEQGRTYCPDCGVIRHVKMG